MIDNLILLFSIAAGMLMIGHYLWLCKKSQKDADLQQIVTCLLNGAGLIGGLVLVLSLVVPELKEKLPELDLYIFIGGIAVIYTSWGGYKSILPEAPKTEPKKTTKVKSQPAQ